MKPEELRLIKQAIISEVEGHEFYKMAAQQTQGEAQAAFLELAEEEMKHIQWLRGLLENDDDAYQLAVLENIPETKIFTWDKVDRKHAGVAVSVFGIGMQMEKAAVQFYSDARDASSDPKVKKIFDILVGWEQSHYNQFEKEYMVHQQDWWSDQGFAPF